MEILIRLAASVVSSQEWTFGEVLFAIKMKIKLGAKASHETS